MSETTENKTEKAPKPVLTAEQVAAKRSLRRKLRVAGRKKRNTKLATDKEFATTFFAARSKRAVDKKASFRKKKSGKK